MDDLESKPIKVILDLEDGSGPLAFHLKEGWHMEAQRNAVPTHVTESGFVGFRAGDEATFSLTGKILSVGIET